MCTLQQFNCFLIWSVLFCTFHGHKLANWFSVRTVSYKWNVLWREVQYDAIIRLNWSKKLAFQPWHTNQQMATAMTRILVIPQFFAAAPVQIICHWISWYKKLYEKIKSRWLSKALVQCKNLVTNIWPPLAFKRWWRTRGFVLWVFYTKVVMSSRFAIVPRHKKCAHMQHLQTSYTTS